MTELKIEYEFYLANKQEYLNKFFGKFVLIKGAKLMGVYIDFSSARADGLGIFGNVAMLIKEVVFEEKVENMPRLVYGRLTH